jgi:L-lactate dehydrogenase
MKIGIIGTGSVGKAAAMATIMRGCAEELVLVDINHKLAKAVALDMQYGASLSPKIIISAGDFSDLHGANLVMITAGINEKTGGATDRNDPQGRLKLFQTNAQIYSEIIPQIVKAAPKATLLVVTDPPDPLADIAHKYAGHNHIISTGTFIDTLRFRYHIAKVLNINPLYINANVIGEHGTSSVFLWSTVHIGGKPLHEMLKQDFAQFRQQVEEEVRFANITIIEGNNASQYGIGMVCARIAEIVLRDERAVITVGSYHKDYGVTFSLPSIVGCHGVEEVLVPSMSAEENKALQHGAKLLQEIAFK